jgi:hypothetical protein
MKDLKEIGFYTLSDERVKNVSKEHNHPCEIPQKLLEKFIL